MYDIFICNGGNDDCVSLNFYYLIFVVAYGRAVMCYYCVIIGHRDTAIGLSLIILYFRRRGLLSVEVFQFLKG